MQMQICEIVFEIRIKGTFDPSFHASERTVYNELRSSTSSDKEQEGTGEKTVKGLQIVPK